MLCATLRRQSWGLLIPYIYNAKPSKACERGMASQAEVARFFSVRLAFVEKLLRLYRRTGALEPDRRRAGRPTLLDAATRRPANKCNVGWPSKTN